MKSATLPTFVSAPDTEAFGSDCSTILRTRPVVHAVPVVATAGLVADTLHAVGASPVMAIFAQEIPILHQRCSSVVLTLGSPDSQRFRLLDVVARSAARRGLAVVLDPVGVGFSPTRLKWACRWIERSSGLVIRGNRAEIDALAGLSAPPDSTPIDAGRTTPAVPPWQTRSKTYGTLASRHVVLATGEKDFLWFGSRAHEGRRGHRLQARVTGMGCALSALCAAFLAVDHDFFAAALHALWLANAAAERAAAQGAGPGTFVPAWLDAVARLTENPGEAWMDRREGEEE